MKRSIFFISLCFLLSALIFLASGIGYRVSAQTSYEIKGIVTDSVSKKALDYITIGLKNDKNELLKTGLTKDDGSFAIADIKTGKYVLSVIAMGYKLKTINLTLAGNSDLGTIYIVPQVTGLDAVTVIADRPIVKMDIDKISYDLQADPESKVNNVLEMMRKVPLLSLDAEDNIQLKGSASYRILINGRPSSMLEKSPKDILRSMPASTIQSIEVITNPPAKYDGEGLSGIINIVTVKKIDNGYNGTINFNQRFPSGGPNLGSSFNFKQGKWGISANLNGVLFHDPGRTNVHNRLILGTNPSDLKQDGNGIYDSRNANTGFQLSYELDSLNLITGQFSYNLGAYDASGYLNSHFNSQSGIEVYRLLTQSEGSRNGRDASLNYQLGFKRNKLALLTLSYRYQKYFNDAANDVQVNDRINYSLPDYYQFNEGSTEEQAVQVDYLQPFKKLNMETGVKGIFREGNTNFLYSSKNGSGEYIPVPLFTNMFENSQQVFSFYNSWHLNTKSWGIKAGVRLEETYLDADFKSSSTKLNQTYLNLLPSVSVTRNFKDKSSLGLGYSQRIQRPGIWDMNPFVDRSNPNMERSGNPDLRPVVGNNLQLTYSRSRKTSFSIGLSHSFINNAIQYVILYDPVTGINRLTLGNNGSNKSTGMNLNISQPITTKWNMNFTTNLNYVFVRGYVDGSLTENEGMKGNFALSTGYRFDKGWRLNANMNYLLTPEILLQGEGIAIFFSGLSVSKELFKEKISVSGSVNNPFNKYMFFPNNIKGENYKILNGGRGYFRSFSYSLNYKFGKLKSPVVKNKREINNDDAL